jgi:hypothetical protein
MQASMFFLAIYDASMVVALACVLLNRMYGFALFWQRDSPKNTRRNVV